MKLFFVDPEEMLSPDPIFWCVFQKQCIVIACFKNKVSIYLPALRCNILYGKLNFSSVYSSCLLQQEAWIHVRWNFSLLCLQGLFESQQLSATRVTQLVFINCHYIFFHDCFLKCCSFLWDAEGESQCCRQLMVIWYDLIQD